MSFINYQRADPRFDWTPLTTQQIRLRNLIQIIGVNFDKGCDHLYFTLHNTPMSAPFYTSESQKALSGTFGRIVTWKEIETRKFPEYVRLSLQGCIIRIWSSENGQEIASWGLYFKGLHFVGSKGDWCSGDFKKNSILFKMPFGIFTSMDSLIKQQPLSILRHVQIEMSKNLVKDSYKVKNLAALHRVQRTLLDERELGRELKLKIGLHGYSTELCSDNSVPTSLGNISLSGKALLRVQQGKAKLKLRAEIESYRLRIAHLRDEKGRSEGRVQRLKRQTMSLEDMSDDLLNRIQDLAKEKQRLHDLKEIVQDNKQKYSQNSSKLFTRKKQLISELLLFYPLTLVGGAKRFSINEIQLPNAEDYGSEGGGQISVALGYTAHMLVTLAFFLGIPLRYPMQHYGSRSRIADHITVQIPDKEREFPLYFRGREDVYSKYAVYLLNKNIAQIRWYCGLSTLDLRATLPNLHNLLTSRLLIPGWPPNEDDESLEVAQEITEEMDKQLYRNDISLSLDQGLDQIGVGSSNKNLDIDNVWLRYSGSYSDLEFAGGSLATDGEIKHGKGQDRFLSGWKKKTYSDSEDIDLQRDPNRWITNSLNLEYDTGIGSPKKRPSISSSPPPFLFVSSSDESTTENRRKQRRIGRVDFPVVPVEVPNKRKLSPSSATGGSQQQPSISPATNIRKLERHIHELERRKSFCDPGPSSRRESRQTPSPSLSNPLETLPHHHHSTCIQKEGKFDDAIADIQRKISLVEMQLQRKNRNETSSSLSTITTTWESPLNMKQQQKEFNPSDFQTLIEHHEITDFQNKSEGAQQQIKDNPGISPKLSEPSASESVNLDPNHVDMCDIITSSVSNDQESKDNHKFNDNDNTSTTSDIIQTKSKENSSFSAASTAGVEIEGSNSNLSKESDSNEMTNESDSVPVVPVDNLISNSVVQQESEISVDENTSEEFTSLLSEFNSFNKACDNSSAENGEDDSLWLRTENLLNSNHSFNLVKRRVSESN